MLTGPERAPRSGLKPRHLVIFLHGYGSNGDDLIALADEWLAGHGVTVASPREEHRRGSHVSLAHPEAWQLTQALIDRGVVPDFRTPDRLRLGPAPLYTRFVDVWDAMDRLRSVLTEGAHESYPTERARVT